jgi:hypothetical protein
MECPPKSDERIDVGIKGSEPVTSGQTGWTSPLKTVELVSLADCF